MKILKIILLVIVVIIAVPLIIGLFSKKEYTVEREITINKPRQVVFGYIKLLKNQDSYSKWMKMDPNAKKTYTGTDGTVGFTSAWESDNKKVGQGTQTITSIAEGDRMDVALHFIKPFDGKADAYYITTDDGPNTKVKWGFHGKTPYPFNVMLLMMNMDQMIGDDLSVGLANLKVIMEK